MTIGTSIRGLPGRSVSSLGVGGSVVIRPWPARRRVGRSARSVGRVGVGRVGRRPCRPRGLVVRPSRGRVRGHELRGRGRASRGRARPRRPSIAPGWSSRCGSAGCSGWSASHASTIRSTTRLRRRVLRMNARPRSELEVLGQAGVAGVALATGLDLGVDVGVGDLDALGVGDLREHEQGLGPPLGVRAEVGVEVVAGLLDGLEVRLLGDALARERAAELVVHHLDLLVDQHVGQVDGRVGHGVFDDPVGEAVAGAVERVALEPAADVAAQLLERLEPPDGWPGSPRRARAGSSRAAP